MCVCVFSYTLCPTVLQLTEDIEPLYAHFSVNGCIQCAGWRYSIQAGHVLFDNVSCYYPVRCVWRCCCLLCLSLWIYFLSSYYPEGQWLSLTQYLVHSKPNELSRCVNPYFLLQLFDRFSFYICRDISGPQRMNPTDIGPTHVSKPLQASWLLSYFDNNYNSWVDWNDIL